MTPIILVILTLNLLVVFVVKSRVNMIIFINTSNLITILLYCLTIGNFILLKELAITTIIYSIVISFLIVSNKDGQSKSIHKATVNVFFVVILTTICALSSFYAIATINDSLTAKKEQNINTKIIKLEKNAKIKTNSKFSYLKIQGAKDNILFNRFGDFIIIICAVIVFLFLGIKHQKES